MTTTTFIRTIGETSLAPGSRQAIDIGGKQVLLCNASGRIHAMSNVCSHAYEKLETGKLGNGWIACPVHGARFDLATGKAKNPPATRPIAVYPVRVADGWIEVQI